MVYGVFFDCVDRVFFFQYICMYKIILQLVFYSRKKSSLPIVGPLGLCGSLSLGYVAMIIFVKWRIYADRIIFLRWFMGNFLIAWIVFFLSIYLYVQNYLTIAILFPEEEFTPHCGSPWFV